MMRLPFLSVSTVVLDGHPLARGLDLLASAGAQAVEPAYIEGYMPFDETSFSAASGQRLGTEIRAAGLGVMAVSAHTDLGQADSIDKLRRRIGFVAAAGARILISNATTSDRAATLARNVEAVLPDLAQHGVTLALENPGHGQDALLPDGTRGAAVVAAFGDPRVRMNYDIGNARTYGGGVPDPARDLAIALPVAAHLHLKDVAAEGADWRFCPIGDGFVGYGTAVTLSGLPAALPVAVEHPIRLWRPGRGAPRRDAVIPDPAIVVAAVRASLARARDLLA